MIEFVLGLIGGLIGGGVLGYLLASHVTSSKIDSAIARASTIPAGDVAKLNTAVAGLGDAAQKLASAAGTPVAAAVNAVTKPQP